MKKTTKTKKPTTDLIGKKQLLVISLLVLLLITFAYFVYSADQLWNSSF